MISEIGIDSTKKNWTDSHLIHKFIIDEIRITSTFWPFSRLVGLTGFHFEKPLMFCRIVLWEPFHYGLGDFDGTTLQYPFCEPGQNLITHRNSSLRCRMMKLK